MIQEEYCTYQEAILLKEEGYNEQCVSYYKDVILHDGKEITPEEERDLMRQGRGKEIKRKKGGCVDFMVNSNREDFLCKKSYCSQPTLSQALRWMREVCKWHIESYPSKAGRWHVWVVSLGEPNPEDGKLNACDLDGKEFKTYETALHYALLFQLKVLADARKFILNGLLKAEESKVKA